MNQANVDFAKAQQFQYQAPSSYAPPQTSPTDMQTHVQRAQEVNALLNRVHMSAIELIGRLYGEGVTATGDQNTKPRAAGLSSEMTEALSSIENVAERLEQVVTRLSQFV